MGEKKSGVYIYENRIFLFIYLLINFFKFIIIFIIFIYLFIFLFIFLGGGVRRSAKRVSYGGGSG